MSLPPPDFTSAAGVSFRYIADHGTPAGADRTPVTATLSGPDTATAGAVLGLHGFRWTGEQTLVLARIDRDEHHHTEAAAEALRAQGIAVDLSPRLRHAIDTDWCFTVFPGMDHVARADIRERAARAQQIYDDITSGRLVVHAHAHEPDGTTVALATYLSGSTVELLDQDHLRHVTATYHDLTMAQALAQFQQRHPTTVRPGPAPATDTEQAIAAALAAAPTAAAAPAPDVGVPASPVMETVSVYAADPGDHERVLNDFFDRHGAWDKVRTWSDETTHASHESLTQRVEFVHDGLRDDVVWTLAAYDSPVSDRRWHATATRSTPAPLIAALLDAFDRDGTSIGPAAVTEQTLTRITRPLADAGWRPVIDGSAVTWTAPDHGADLRFDARAYGQSDSPLPAWTLRGLHDGAPASSWTVGFSRDTPEDVLDALAFDLAHQTGTRHARTTPSAAQARGTGLPPTPPASPRPSAHR
ncbi:DUF317 domain-containing protein [Streptomyces sp. NPDC059070]|uniref:DUF317 domain-containing protein n=1 Tax=Streptomyces sp. NPDC059070 TaxID=3346713 RepID=UPI00367BD9A5